MKIGGIPYRTIWLAEDGRAVNIIDQARLPHELRVVRLETAEAAARAISGMQVRGAPLIGATAAYGVALAMGHDLADAALDAAVAMLAGTRPTAINLRWALDRMLRALAPVPRERRASLAYTRAAEICEEDVASCYALGQKGLPILRETWERAGRSRPVRVLTHCNAGWLAAVDWGTALAPVYAAHDAGIPVHVWVDETRPRNQGMLTAWELGNQGVPHTIVADNAGGHLMQRGLVDLCIVGTDRTTAAGDVCNKIGTYLKALAARANRIPFYVAVPTSSIDWTIRDGLVEIPIEERAAREVTVISGLGADGKLQEVVLAPAGSPAANPGFDVTPAALVTALITERGVVPASADGLASLGALGVSAASPP